MKVKRLIPALAMLLIAAMLMGTSTFAWFSMNQTVTAKNMKVTAVAEKGIVIAAKTGNTTAAAAADFASEDDTNATVNPLTELHPVFTNGTGTTIAWYHAASTKSNDGQVYSADGYASVDNIEGVDANTDGDYDDTGDTVPMNYYMVNRFEIKSTGGPNNVYVKNIVATLADDSAAAQDYSKALRVLVKTSEAALIFAPLNASAAATETALAATAATDDVASDVEAAIITSTGYNKLATKVLTAVAATPQDVEIYIYFDGEDVNCKSDNIPATAFEQLKVAVEFTSETPAA